jgi:hypothetical protein
MIDLDGIRRTEYRPALEQTRRRWGRRRPAEDSRQWRQWRQCEEAGNATEKMVERGRIGRPDDRDGLPFVVRPTLPMPLLSMRTGCDDRMLRALLPHGYNGGRTRCPSAAMDESLPLSRAHPSSG